MTDGLRVALGVVGITALLWLCMALGGPVQVKPTTSADEAVFGRQLVETMKQR